MSTEAERDFSRYVDSFLRPLCNEATSNGALIAFLAHELDGWELEAERSDGIPWAPMVV
jgi:hypothetical protein